MNIKRDKNNKYGNNKLDNLVIRVREKRRSNIYKLFEGLKITNRADGRQGDIYIYSILNLNIVLKYYFNV